MCLLLYLINIIQRIMIWVKPIVMYNHLNKFNFLKILFPIY